MTHTHDNIDIAILTKINDLASRYGLKPYHFTATLDHSSENDYLGVTFVVPGETIGNDEKQVKKMLRALGVSFPEGVLKGGDVVVIDALDNALHLAPKPHSRRPG